MRRWVPLAAWLASVACTSADRGPGEPPPATFPWLANTYDVEVTLMGSTCSPGGFEPVAMPAVADVWQNGSTVEWRQETSSINGDFWYLTGALCARGDGHVLRLTGGRRDTVSGCQVRTTVPAGGAEAKADPCTAPGYLELEFEPDGCGGLKLASAPVAARLAFGRSCAWRSACELQIDLHAVPSKRDIRAPAPPEACTY